MYYLRPNVGELLPDLLNGPSLTDRQRHRARVKQIGRSIKRFGFVIPILVDRNNRISASVKSTMATWQAQSPSDFATTTSVPHSSHLLRRRSVRGLSVKKVSISESEAMRPGAVR